MSRFPLDTNRSDSINKRIKMRYYKPLKKEIRVGLICELYNTEDSQWYPFKVENVKATRQLLHEDNIRVKYLDENDWRELGYTIQRIHEGTIPVYVETVFKDGKEEDIYTEEDLWNTHDLQVYLGGKMIGMFHPFNEDITFNMKLYGKKYMAKNKFELELILDK